MMRVLDHKEYGSIWLGMWWVLQTVTTVGYGDLTPNSAIGKILTSVVMLWGVAFLAIITAAIVWVLFASWQGLPVSTTHAILGGLCGSAVALLGLSGIEWVTVLKNAALPLALSPVVAFLVTWSLPPVLEATLGRWSGYCLCLQARTGTLIAVNPQGESRILYQATGADVVVDSPRVCERSQLSGLTIGMDSIHWLSSGAASFARGLNDAPKIVSLMLIVQAASGPSRLGTVIFVLSAISMGLGSYLGGRRVTEVLAEKITRMNHTEGLAANLTTSVLVAATAVLGMPVSTTHVSSSAIIAVGARKGLQAVRWTTVKGVVLAWVVTVPVATLLGGVLAFVLRLFM